MDVLGRQWKDYTFCKNLSKTAAQTLIYGATVQSWTIGNTWSVWTLKIDCNTASAYSGDVASNLFSPWRCHKQTCRPTYALTVSSSSQLFWRLISRTCCSCHLLGPNPSKWQWQPAVAHLSRYSLENQHLNRQDPLSLQNMTGKGFFNFLSSKACFEGERWTFATCHSSGIFTCKYHFCLRRSYCAFQSSFGLAMPFSCCITSVV